MIGIGRYYAPDGTEIDQKEWARLIEERDNAKGPESWWRKRTVINHQVLDDEGHVYLPHVEVSTVWVGINHQFSDDAAPLFWETMIFGGQHDQDCWRYATREEAFDHHEEVVRALRDGEEPT